MILLSICSSPITHKTDGLLSFLVRHCMNSSMKQIIFLLLFLPGLATAAEYKVVKVIDGDTIDIIFRGKKERVRLLCVNTPESVHRDRHQNTYMGWKASRYTKSRLSGKKIHLEFEKRRTRGNYGRLLAYVIIDSRNFNLELVEQGWSQYYTKYGHSERYHAQFIEAEASARTAMLHVWSDKKPPLWARVIFSGYTWDIVKLVLKLIRFD